MRPLSPKFERRRLIRWRRGTRVVGGSASEEFALAEKGRMTGMIGAAREMTDRDQVEETLRLQSLAIEVAANAIVITDAEGVILSVNQAFTRLTGYSVSEVIGKKLCILKSGCHDSAFYADMWRTIRSGQVWEGQVFNRRKDGLIYVEEMTITPIHDALGVITHFIAIKSDVTQRRRTENALEQGRLVAEKASKTKSEFLANMSHEIRTPMTALLGYSEQLLAPDLTDGERRQAIHAIHRNGEHLLNIINDILDFSKIEADRMTVERSACPLAPLLAELVSTIRLRADHKGLNFRVNFLSRVPETLHTDPLRLRQILINILSNAVKFTRRGVIQCDVSFSRAADKGYIYFDVIDTGIGMNGITQQHLFQPFTQADASTTRRFGGTGLGLTISRRLARLLGGDVFIIHSAPEIGSHFRVMIDAGPLDRISIIDGSELMISPPVETYEASGRPLEGRRLLLAEDGPDNQKLIRHILEKAGAKVTVVEDGAAAVERAMEQGRVGQPYDIIVMDMQMPIMDGYKATRALRERGYSGVIVALTAHAMDEQRKKCLDAGCDEYAAKPIRTRRLLETLARHLPPSA